MSLARNKIKSLALLLGLLPPLVWADGIPVNRKTGKVIVPHTIISLTAEQEQEVIALGTLTLTQEQWQQRREKDSNAPIRATAFPITYDDCMCGQVGSYVVVLSDTKAALFPSDKYQYLIDDSIPLVIEEGVRMDRQGEFFCFGMPCPFATVLEAFSAQKKWEQEYGGNLPKVIEAQTKELADVKQSDSLSPKSKKEEIARLESWIAENERKLSGTRKPLVVRLPLGITRDSPTVKERLDALQAKATEEGWPALDVRCDGDKREAMTKSNVAIELNAQQIFEVEKLGQLTLTSEQWEDIRKRYPFARKRVDYRMLSPTRAIVAKESLAVDVLGQMKKSWTESYGVELSVDRRGQFYYEGSLVPFQKLLDAVREASRDIEKNPSFIIQPPAGMDTAAAPLKSRVGLLREAAKEAGFNFHIRGKSRSVD